MSEETINKKINRAKKTAALILKRAEYKVEPASNKTYCLNAMRQAEWRMVKIGIEEILNCNWFIKEVENLKKMPNPSPDKISKEMWIRAEGEYNFKIFYWKNGQWFNSDDNPVDPFRPSGH